MAKSAELCVVLLLSVLSPASSQFGGGRSNSIGSGQNNAGFSLSGFSIASFIAWIGGQETGMLNNICPYRYLQWGLNGLEGFAQFATYFFTCQQLDDGTYNYRAVQVNTPCSCGAITGITLLTSPKLIWTNTACNGCGKGVSASGNTQAYCNSVLGTGTAASKICSLASAKGSQCAATITYCSCNQAAPAPPAPAPTTTACSGSLGGGPPAPGGPPALYTVAGLPVSC